MVEDRDILTVEQVAEILQLHYQTVYAKVRNGEIPAFKIGQQWRVLRKDLFKYIEGLKRSSKHN